jgi:adenylosuccinate lyase
MNREQYINPYMLRYGTTDMRYVFSDEYRHKLWRLLWYVLAEAQHKVGVSVITEEHLIEINNAMAEDINYDNADKYERETRHDVVAHLREFGDHCPNAKKILHLGATSCYVVDNADILIMRDALYLVKNMLELIIDKLVDIAREYQYIPIVGRTHLQKAQLTTVGKRICMWINDFYIDLNMIINTINNLGLLGCKGATGSQSSLYTLFDGDFDKATTIDVHIGNYFEMKCIAIAGQTYTRKYDSIVANTLSQIAQSASKMATDIRLMSATGEMYEGFGDGQVGSSAMPYKRNPINCEKICGIARSVICNSQNMAITASTQWLERTLDDSSNKRIVMPELFLGISEIMNTLLKVIDGLTVNIELCYENAKEHSKMASLEDDIIIKVMSGGDRQDAHKDAIYSNGSDNAEINIGFAEEQVELFLRRIGK